MKNKKKIFAMTDRKNARNIKTLIKKLRYKFNYEIFFVGNQFNKYDLLRFEPDYIIEHHDGNEIFAVDDYIKLSRVVV